MRKNIAFACVLALGVSALLGGAARAAEDAAGFYLLGSKGAMAGFVPPPGTYLSDVTYSYAGDASGAAAAGVASRRAGRLTVEADVAGDGTVAFAIPSALWVAPGKLLGGNAGFGIVVPIGWKDVDVDIGARARLDAPALGVTLERERRFAFGDSTGNFGDPLAAAVLGWSEGNWHWNAGALVNIPIGQWEKDNIANIGFNHWGLDASAAATWLDPKIGFEVSAAAGFTFNWETPDTDYKPGAEFHLEFAVLQHFSKTFAIGLAGYHYDQMTGDSGSGAALGSFKGRVTALGPIVAYNFELGKSPVSANLKWAREFSAENRLEGDALQVTLSLPLAADSR